MDIKEEAILKEKAHSHWYYVAKGLALKKLVEGLSVESILDVGAGSGVFSKILLRDTGAKEAVCLDTGYELEREEQFCGKRISFVKDAFGTEAGLGLATDSGSATDLVLMIDILEHIDNDVSFVKRFVERSGDGAHFAVAVPAFQSLFSGHDIFLEHKRRYRLSSLESCLKDAGLTVLKSHYFFLPFFPMVALKRLLFGGGEPKSDLKLYGPLLNSLLLLAHRIELPFARFNRFAGLTAFCLAKKSDAGRGAVSR